MPKALKLALAIAAALAGISAATLSAAVWMGERKLHRAVEVRVVPVPFVRDAAALKQGKYLFDSRGCAHCHGAEGQGAVVIDDPKGLYVRAPDISPGGTGSRYSEADWVRAVRHGIAPDGRALLIMPSEDYNRMSDPDLAALVAYARSLPRGAGQTGEVRLPLFAKALYGAGQILDAAEKIDHRLPPAQPVPVGATVEHGAYVAQMCIGCHGPMFSGGSIPGSPPDWPTASNLTPGQGSVMGIYGSVDEFTAMMRTGKRPDGTEVSAVMPFAALKNLSDVDLEAVHAYLTTLPARTAGRR